MEQSNESLDEQLISVCRTAIGDQLRSITYFTSGEYRQIYLRSDLEQDADVGQFVENERHGFTSQRTYGQSELGKYRFTIRAFEHGYLTRVIVGEAGVYVTTDSMRMDNFDEVATAVTTVLQDASAD